MFQIVSPKVRHCYVPVKLYQSFVVGVTLYGLIPHLVALNPSRTLSFTTHLRLRRYFDSTSPSFGHVPWVCDVDQGVLPRILSRRRTLSGHRILWIVFFVSLTSSEGVPGPRVDHYLRREGGGDISCGRLFSFIFCRYGDP